jgi:hypothetical protein
MRLRCVGVGVGEFEVSQKAKPAHDWLHALSVYGIFNSDQPIVFQLFFFPCSTFDVMVTCCIHDAYAYRTQAV